MCEPATAEYLTEVEVFEGDTGRKGTVVTSDVGLDSNGSDLWSATDDERNIVSVTHNPVFTNEEGDAIEMIPVNFATASVGASTLFDSASSFGVPPPITPRNRPTKPTQPPVKARTRSTVSHDMGSLSAFESSEAPMHVVESWTSGPQAMPLPLSSVRLPANHLEPATEHLMPSMSSFTGGDEFGSHAGFKANMSNVGTGAARMATEEYV